MFSILAAPFSINPLFDELVNLLATQLSICGDVAIGIDGTSDGDTALEVDATAGLHGAGYLKRALDIDLLFTLNTLGLLDVPWCRIS